ncbi:hypothetical protein [Nostoc sp. CENA543]|nr:hypothetical protein [Nostoc sp. CENA543]
MISLPEQHFLILITVSLSVYRIISLLEYATDMSVNQYFYKIKYSLSTEF